MCRRCARRSSWWGPACRPAARSVSSTCATSRQRWPTAPAWRCPRRTARTSCPKRSRLRRPERWGAWGPSRGPQLEREEDMDYGVVMFATAYAIAPDELGRALEERGFESLWIPEHTHIPASRRSPWPGGPNLPQEYWSSYDPFLALTMAAAATKRLRLGTGICLVVERDPITTAKEVATLDRLSGGRFLFGIGGGWNAEEMENHGTP